jgi:transcriptional antiterminator NusG
MSLDLRPISDEARRHAEVVADGKWGQLWPIPVPERTEPCPGGGGGDPAWHIALTGGVKEATAEEMLIYRGFEVYRPTFITSVRQNYFKRRNVRRSFFPGYIFVRFDETDLGWKRIYAVRGIGGMIERSFERPAIVPERAIAIVRDKEAELQALFEVSAAKASKKAGGRGKIAMPFKVGDAVEVDDEVWRYQVGRIEKLDDRGRITVLMALFGRVTPIEVSVNQVRVL